MSEDKSPRKQGRVRSNDPDELQLEDELSHDEFLEQFGDEEPLETEELSEEEFFAAFDRHQSGESPIFADEDDELGEEEESSTASAEMSQQYADDAEYSEDESYHYSESTVEEPATTPPLYASHTEPVQEEEEYYEEEEIYDEEEDPYLSQGGDSYEAEQEYGFDAPEYSEGSLDEEEYSGEDFFDPNQPLFEEEEEYPEEEPYDEPDSAPLTSVRLSEGLSYDLESRLNLPRKPRRRGRFLETLLSLILLPIVFAVAGVMGLYIYKPELVVPHVPVEYRSYLPKFDSPPAEPTLPPGVLDAVMTEELTVEEPEVEATPTPVFTRVPIGVIEAPTPTPSPSVTPEPQNTRPPSPATPKPTPVEAVKPASTKAPAVAAPVASLPAGDWYVQVSAETTPKAAEKLKGLLMDDGLPGDVYSIEVRGRKYYRVVVGPTTKEEADRLMLTLPNKSYISNTPFVRQGR